jgi:hypothetical protein
MLKKVLYLYLALLGTLLLVVAAGHAQAPAPVTVSVTAGTLQAISPTCDPGSLYIALDQPLGQQIYVCNQSASGNGWFQMGTLGGSGALKMEQGTLDINLAVVPRLTNPMPALAPVTATYVVTNAATFPLHPLPPRRLIFRNGLYQTLGTHYDAVGANFRFRPNVLSNGDTVSVVTLP